MTQSYRALTIEYGSQLHLCVASFLIFARIQILEMTDRNGPLSLGYFTIIFQYLGFGFFSELVLGLVSNSVAGVCSDELVPKCVYVIV